MCIVVTIPVSALFIYSPAILYPATRCPPFSLTPQSPGLAHPLRSPVTRQLSEYLSQPVTPAPLQIAELISICAHHAVDCLQATSSSCVLLTSLHLPTHLCVSLPVLRTVHQPVLQQLPLLKMICFCMH